GQCGALRLSRAIQAGRDAGGRAPAAPGRDARRKAASGRAARRLRRGAEGNAQEHRRHRHRERRRGGPSRGARRRARVHHRGSRTGGRESSGAETEIESPVAARARLAAPPAAVSSVDQMIRELDRFFSENGDALGYFAAEAAEHLDVMTAAMLALERSSERTERSSERTE